ncbi:MFS transporter [Thermobifida halotolerans]|uniref:MFS transporter n=1 Tax=Thermobifida halotolerans TaxID=483545 RepID=A0AA97LY80_9ACTN|nr:MFS transporter [Thermobifida halotolerans]UOE20255.1 MFS transporter [Thermobifida halotolerans]
MTRTGEHADEWSLDSPRIRSIQRRVLTVLVAAQAVGGIGLSASLTVGGLIAQDITGTETWAGMATTMATLGAAVCALPLATAAARRGRRGPLSLGWFLAAGGGAVSVLGAQAGLFSVFLVGMVLFGAGGATGLQSRHAAADLATDRNRGRDLSIVVWATTVGSVLGPNLTTPGAAVAGWLGLSPLLGVLVIASAAFAAAGAVTAALMRPDPLLTARALTARTAAPRSRAAAPAGGRPGALTARTAAPRSRAAAPAGGRPGALAALAAAPRAVLALVAITAGHAIMVMVMTMTPVHMEHGGVDLTVIGVTLSLHIAGMYALSPLVGWLSDRLGRMATLLVGQVVLIAAVTVSALAGHGPVMVTVGLVLLGVGWSFGLVSGSALLAESLRPDQRPALQGVSDLLMNAGGAASGALSGILLALLGYGGLNAVAAALTVPVFALAAFVLLSRTSGEGET